ncbi:MAG: hypothetical protein OEM24_13380 [Paracoccaceae bacterium]|nr:hypothetical protein [Paracoccaceae bacterium]
MTTNDAASVDLPPGAAEARILFVSYLPGEPPDDITGGRFGQDIEVVDFSAVTAALLKSFDPHFVVSPILTSGFDILDLGTRLWQLRYQGAYRVLTETTLPNPALVLREVRSHCPGLDVDLLSMDALRR